MKRHFSVKRPTASHKVGGMNGVVNEVLLDGVNGSLFPHHVPIYAGIGDIADEKASHQLFTVF